MHASSFTGIAPSSSLRSVDPTRKHSDWHEKPELYGHLLNSDKSLPDDELLDITNLEPIPGTPLLSPRLLLEESNALNPQVSNFKLPYGIDTAIEGVVESHEEDMDGPLVEPDASDSSVGANDDTSSDIAAESDILHDSSTLLGPNHSIESEAAAAISNPAVEETRTAEAYGSSRTVPYILKPGDSVESLATRFSLSQQAILNANEEESLAEKVEGDVIHLPWVPTVLGHEDFSTANHEAVRLARLEMLPTEDVMIWPTSGRLTSGYGWRGGRIHAGIDIVGPVGTPVVAVMSGRVIYSGWYYGYGYMVDIEHANGTVTRYAHASRLHVSVGEQVRQGQLIMAMGSTGRSTGPHLHFEVRQNGYSINPLTVLNGSSPSQNVATTY